MMPTELSYSIVPARLRDLLLIGAIELAAAALLKGHAPDTVLAETTSLEELKNAQSDGRLWVALAGNTPVGFAHVEILGPATAHLEEIDVHPDHSRRGLGRLLVSAVCKWADEHGFEEVTLTTFRDVPWNMPFYVKLGFEEIPSKEMTAELTAVVGDESERGLDPKRRVVMRWRPSFQIERIKGGQ
jgi:GNAT superfamily N-acetyltransferase